MVEIQLLQKYSSDNVVSGGVSPTRPSTFTLQGMQKDEQQQEEEEEAAKDDDEGVDLYISG